MKLHSGVVAYDEPVGGWRPGDVIGEWRDGRLIHLAAGAADDDGEDGRSGGDGDEGEGSGDDGDPFDEGGDGAEGDDNGDGDDGDGSGQVDLSHPSVQAEVDRRVNQALRRRERRSRRRGHEDDGDDGDGEDRGRDGSRGRRRRREAEVSAADVREGRLAYREYVGDDFRFLGRAERAHAAELASGLIRERLGQGADVEDVGRDVAEDVQETLRSLRKMYFKQAVATLKKQGVVSQDFDPAKRQPKKGREVKSEGGQVSDGQSRARQMFPDRFPSK